MNNTAPAPGLPAQASNDPDSVFLRDSSFIISCAARTGSTLLVHLLRSNPRILCHGETINTAKLGPMTGSYERNRHAIPGYEELIDKEFREHPARFIFSNLFDSQGRQSVGFKYKTDEAFHPDYEEYTDIIAGDPSIKVVHLRRRNLLDQYVSHQVVLHQTGVTLLRDGDEEPDIEQFRCDLGHAEAYFANVVSREEKALSIYRSHRGFFVDYEDLVDESKPARNELQTFLGVEPEVLHSPTKKIIASNHHLLLNLDEALESLSAAGYTDRLG